MKEIKIIIINILLLVLILFLLFATNPLSPTFAYEAISEEYLYFDETDERIDITLSQVTVQNEAVIYFSFHLYPNSTTNVTLLIYPETKWNLTHFQVNIIQLWNSNMFVSSEGMELLLDVMDFWLPDLKFFENEFAYGMAKAKNYKETITRNIKMAYDNGFHEMIVRHLVMPGRVEADTLPILDWCARNVERAFVNIMAQWRPEHKVHGNPRYQSLDKRVISQEMDQARNYADQLGIHWREVH